MDASAAPNGEFELIARYFSATGGERDDVLLGVGDDAALLEVPPGTEAICGSATACEGSDPAALAGLLYDAAARDLAVARAEPQWATLALTVPHVEAAWLSAFSQALHARLAERGVTLVGGDTTRGPSSVSLFLIGLRPASGPAAGATDRA